MEQGVLEYERVREKKKQLLIKIQETKPNLERSGMGFTIMESFMDKMKVESILGLGTKVTMSKIIKPKIESEEEQFEALLEN